jgi:N-acetyl-gamma-glutamyl-phosphate reductase
MIKVGIVGGTGYTGAELLRLLAMHPHARVEILTSRQEAGKRADEIFPHLRGHCSATFVAPDVRSLAQCQAVFFATPHGTAMKMAPELVAAGVKVIDLSADFRLKDANEYRHWYSQEHEARDLLAEAVYGLPEANRGKIKSARVVAAPGCYPTAVQLGFMPMLEAGVAETDSLIADCKSGVSGAGRELKLGSMFCEATDSMKAYAVPGHRHVAEMVQGLTALAKAHVRLTFVPHLVPMTRGIHATLYARLKNPSIDLRDVYATRYAVEPFVDVLPEGAHPETRSVRGANFCQIAVHKSSDGRSAVVLCVIDNLVKGASGQAVQCFNIMFGLDEKTSLSSPALAP